MIYIVIPVHNRIDKTICCLESIKIQNYKNINVIMVDDGSSDSTTERVGCLYPETTILHGDGGLFWTGAVHFGIKHALSICSQGDWILLVNNDTKLNNNTIEELVVFSTNHQRKVLASAVSVNSLNRDIIIKSGTIVKSWVFNITQHVLQGMRVSELLSHKPIEVDLLTARCLLHPVEIFKAIGNYNAELLPHYGGDDEFTVRASKNGYKAYVLPSAIVYLDEDTQATAKLNIIQQLFGFRSSLNIINRWKFARAAVPIYALPSYYFMAIVKSLYVIFKRNQKNE